MPHISKKEHLINEEITVPQVRLVGEDGAQLGIVSIDTAQNLSIEKGLDLVMIAPKAAPPVCRIMDYGKFRFEQDKREALRTQWLLKTNWHYQFYRYPKSMTTLNWGHVLVTGESSQAIKEQVAATGIWDKLEE